MSQVHRTALRVNELAGAIVAVDLSFLTRKPILLYSALPIGRVAFMLGAKLVIANECASTSPADSAPKTSGLLA